MQTSILTPLHDVAFIRRYRIVNVIKSDALRQVSMAIYLKGLWFKKCIIKQGYYNSQHIAETLTTRKRLAREFELLQILRGSLPVPEPLEIFEEKKNTYLVLSFVKGKSLRDTIDELYCGSDFASLPIRKKQTLLRSLLLLAENVKSLHDRGYVHRDIAPGNFLVRGENMYLIDLELACPVGTSTKSPDYFPGWTEGFSSPEQVARCKPRFQQDIYSLGALMFMTFTREHPRVLKELRASSLAGALKGHCVPELLIEIMTHCLHHDPSERPTVNELIYYLRAYRDILLMNRLKDPLLVNAGEAENLEQSRHNSLQNYYL